jgi:hypothetical protein
MMPCTSSFKFISLLKQSLKLNPFKPQLLYSTKTEEFKNYKVSEIEINVPGGVIAGVF